MSRASLIGFLCVLLASLALAADRPPHNATNETRTLDGQVVPLADLLEKFGSRLDPEAASQWLALVTKEGDVYPLIRDDGSRLFFLDRQLLNRPLRLTGRLFRDTHLLQVLSANSYKTGQLHEIYYWCDVCSIRRNEKLPRCECCGGPMSLREEPIKK